MDTPAPPGVRIVFMDDDEAIQRLVQMILTKEGYQVRVACNGLEGMKLLEEEPAELVITDLVMPVQEGLESIMLLRRKYPEIKIIAVSGGLQRGVIDMLPTADKLGANRTMRKPLLREELLQAIAEVLAE
jgi:CheY-like chemotaxis protein